MDIIMENNISYTVIFIGRSGSGKGTQAGLLEQYFKDKGISDVYHLESGKHFRDFIKEGKNYSASIANDINEKGGLQPQFLSAMLWSQALVSNMRENTSLIIDGTPRRLAEAKVLETAFEFYGIKKVFVFHLNVIEDESVKRLQNRGRHDDKDMENVAERLSWFETDVAPVIDYYSQGGIYEMVEIDGMQSVEDVHKDVVENLGL